MAGVQARPVRRRSPEKTEDLLFRRYCRFRGLKYYSLSQARASKQTPGLPDHLVFLPRLVMVELKGVKGKQSPAQIEFQQYAEANHIPYVVGTYEVVKAALEAMIGAASP